MAANEYLMTDQELRELKLLCPNLEDAELDTGIQIVISRRQYHSINRVQSLLARLAISEQEVGLRLITKIRKLNEMKYPKKNRPRAFNLGKGEPDQREQT